MPTTAASAWSATNRLDPLFDAEDAIATPVALVASLTYAKGQVLAQVEKNESATLTIVAAGGTFKLIFGAQTTGAIAYNAAASDVEDAFEALSTVGEGNATITGNAGGPYAITFTGQLSDTDVTAITTDATSLSGGADTAVVSAVVTGVPAGKFGKYDAEATDGTQTARGILQYGCTTDSASLITLPGEFGATATAMPMFFKGTFRTQDVVGLDDAALASLGGHLIYGTLANGAFII